MFTRRTDKNSFPLYFIIYVVSLFCLFLAQATNAYPYTSSGQVSYWQLPIPAQGIPAKNLPDILSNLNASNCGTCHPKQYQEWQSSFHANAVGDGLLGQLYAFDQETQKECLRCHAPRTEQIQKLVGSEPKAQPVTSGGVGCASCHVRSHIRHGSRNIKSTPHGTVKGLPLFKQSEFCKSCHQFDETGEVVNGKPLENTYAEWLASPQARQGQTCQSCHMPDKRHHFRGIHDAEMTRQGLSIHLSRVASGIIVKLGNTGAGHALPTYITPRIVTEIKSSTGKILRDSIQRQMSWDEISGWKEISDTRLLPGQWKTLSMKLDVNESVSLTVQVEPDADYHDRVYPALLDLLEGELHGSQIKQLQQARKKAGESIYTLYAYECSQWTPTATTCVSTLE